MGQKEWRIWRISPAGGGMRKGEADGNGTSSSPSSERVCRGGDETAKVRGEHRVKSCQLPRAEVWYTQEARELTSCDHTWISGRQCSE